jgi:NhaP-type Na+/H+ or K+/H+ antiporter
MDLSSLYLIAAILIMIGYAYFSIYREEYSIKFIHHSGFAILMGIGFGAVLKYFFNSTLEFTSAIFFDFMLPLIIFEQGYNMKRKRFFKNMGSIALFGFLGTIICFMLVGIGNLIISDRGWIVDWNGNTISIRIDEAFKLAAILCSSDTLEVLTLVSDEKSPKLHSVLFGEGAINAAISILLFDTFRHINLETFSIENVAVFTAKFFGNFLGSFCLGIFFGLLTSWCMKKSEALSRDASSQTAILLYISYLSYLFAGVCTLSTIITLLICAITNSHYTWYNLSPEAQHVSSNTFKVMGNTAEAITFAYIGLSTWSIVGAHNFSWSFLVLELGLLLAVRAISIVLCTLCVMIVTRKKYYLGLGQLAVLWLGGSIKGAIVYGLINVVSGPHQDLMIITVVGLVFITTVGIEFILPCIVDICNLKEDIVNLKDVGNLAKDGAPMTNLLLMPPNQHYHINTDDIVTKKSWFHGLWRRFDDRYLKTFLIRKEVLDEIKEVKREIVKDAILSIGPKFSILGPSEPLEPLLEVN